MTRRPFSPPNLPPYDPQEEPAAPGTEVGGSLEALDAAFIVAVRELRALAAGGNWTPANRRGAAIQVKAASVIAKTWATVMAPRLELLPPGPGGEPAPARLPTAAEQLERIGKLMADPPAELRAVMEGAGWKR